MFFKYAPQIALALLLMGPAINLTLLPKITHAHFGLAIGLVLLMCAKKEALMLGKSFFPMLVFVVVSYLIHKHEGISSIGHYYQYVYIVVFGYALFLVSWFCMTQLNEERQVVVFLPLIVFLMLFVCEFFLGTGWSTLEIKHPYSALHGNVNNQAYGLLLLTSIYILLFEKQANFKLAILLFLVTLMYAIFVGSRIVVIFTVLQMLFLLVPNVVYNTTVSRRQWGYILLISSVAAIVIVYMSSSWLSEQINLYISKAYEGNIHSGHRTLATRLYFIVKAFETLDSFSWVEWLFGMGFGQFYVINPFESGAKYWPLHNVYLEVLVNNGMFFYITYLAIFKNLGVQWKCLWPKIILFFPVFVGAVALSSAIYFAPFYVFLASVVYKAKEEDK